MHENYPVAITDLNLTRLERYMRQHVPDFSGALEGVRIGGGQSNPTYRLSADGKHYILRRKPSGALLPSAHAIDREYRVMSALAGTDVPVPRTYCLCMDDEVIGTAFFIMECVEGRILFDPSLPGFERAERAAMYDAMNHVIGALHSLDYSALGLANFGRQGNFFGRQIARWTKQYRAAETEKIEAMERLIAWLPEHIPSSDETCLVHGDFRLDNLIFHPTEPRVLAVIDWELSTLGHPLGDLAYHAMAWRLGPEEFRGLMGCDLSAVGIPDEGAYVDSYCRRTGRDHIPYWDFYIAYNMFRLAAILQGIAARAMAGNAASADAQTMGQRARPLAQAGWRQVEQLLARASPNKAA